MVFIDFNDFNFNELPLVETDSVIKSVSVILTRS